MVSREERERHQIAPYPTRALPPAALQSCVPKIRCHGAYMLRFPRRLLLPAAVALVPSLGVAQTVSPTAQQFEKLHFRSIGPAIMSGRISDLAVYEKNTSIWYVGTAHGGVWKTTSNGATFTPLLQTKGLLAIGDVAVSQQNPDVVWVGSGEANNRQTTSWGDGVWKSTDGGKTFA